MLVSNTSLAEIFKNHPWDYSYLRFSMLWTTMFRGTLKKIADVGIKEIESAFSKKGGVLRHEAEKSLPRL